MVLPKQDAKTCLKLRIFAVLQDFSVREYDGLLSAEIKKPACLYHDHDMEKEHASIAVLPKHSLQKFDIYVCFMKLPVCIWLLICTIGILVFGYVRPCFFLPTSQLQIIPLHVTEQEENLPDKFSLSVASWLFLCVTRTGLHLFEW